MQCVMPGVMLLHSLKSEMLSPLDAGYEINKIKAPARVQATHMIGTILARFLSTTISKLENFCRVEQP